MAYSFKNIVSLQAANTTEALRKRRGNMNDNLDKSEKIKKNIESTILNAIETEKQISNMDHSKQKSALIAKNVRRAEAMPSMIREYKEEEAKEELGLE